MADLLARHAVAGDCARQDHVENRRLVEHDAARQAHDRDLAAFALTVAEQEHRARQYRRPVRHDVDAGIADGGRRAVVRVDAHAARAEDDIHAEV